MTPHTKPLTSHYWLLFLVMTLAIFFRVFWLGTVPPGLYPDEAMNGTDAFHANETGHYSVFYPANNGREGLFINLQALALKAAHGNYPVVLRGVSALFGILTVFGLYLLAREMFNPVVGLWAAFFMATGFWHVTFSRIGFRAISAPFWLVWALFFFLLGFRKLSEGKGLQTTLQIHMLAGLLFGLGFHSYIAYRVTPALVLVIAVYYYILARRSGWVTSYLANLAGFVSLTIAAALPLLLYFMRASGSFSSRTASISIFSQRSPLLGLAGNIAKELMMFNFIGDMNWRANFAARPELSGPVGVLFIIGVVAGIAPVRNFLSEFYSLVRSHNASTSQEVFPAGDGFSLVILLFWFLLTSLPALLSTMGGPSSIRFLLLMPVAYMLAGLGATRTIALLRPVLSAFALRIGCALFCIALIVETGALYLIVWPRNANTKAAFTADYTEIANTINALPVNTPKYVVYPHFGYDLKQNLSVPAQTIMFLTNTIDEDQQKTKNVHYVMEGQDQQLPAGAQVFRLRVYDQGQAAQ